MDIQKTAWVDNERRIVSFQPMSGAQKIEKPEQQFWELVQRLMKLNYRIM